MTNSTGPKELPVPIEEKFSRDDQVRAVDNNSAEGSSTPPPPGHSMRVAESPLPTVTATGESATITETPRDSQGNIKVFKIRGALAARIRYGKRLKEELGF